MKSTEQVVKELKQEKAELSEKVASEINATPIRVHD